jgi:hypothetical protein
MFWTRNDLPNDFVGIEFGEMMVVPRGHRHKGSIAVDRVDVGRLLKLDSGVTFMSVLLGQIVESYGCCRHFIINKVFSW